MASEVHRDGDIIPKQSKMSSYVQLKREDYQKIKTNFTLIKAKYVDILRENQSLKNLYSTLSEKDEDLKIFKSQAHKYELAYIRAETNLTNLCMRLRQQSGNQALDISSLLRALDEEKSLPIGSGLHIPKHVEQTDKASMPHESEREEKRRDIETDGVSQSLPSDSDTEGKERLDAEQVRPPYTSASQHGNVQERLAYENQVLSKKIHQFEKDSEAWAKFKAQEEQSQLIEELRLELARVQVQNRELKLLLQAKQNNNIDALTGKLADNVTLVKKLEKQLLAKHAVLNQLQQEYKRIKAEYDKMCRLQNEASTSLVSERTRSGEESLPDRGYISSAEATRELADNTNALQLEKESGSSSSKAASESEAEIMRLKQTNHHLSEQLEECVQVIKDLKDSRRTLDDQPVTMSILREERDKLRERVRLFEQELHEERTNYGILEGQTHLVQSELADTKRALHAAEMRIKQSVGTSAEHLEEKLAIAEKNLRVAEAEKNAAEENHRLAEEKNVKLRQENSRNKENINKLTVILNSKSQQVVNLEQQLSEQKQKVKEFHLRNPDGGTSRPIYHESYQTHYQYPYSHSSPYSLYERSEPQTVADCSSYSSSHQSGTLLAGNQSNAGSSSLLHYEVADGEGFVCERCLREFEPHEQHKYNEHIKKCQD